MLNDRPQVERGRSYGVGATNSRELKFYTYNIKVLRWQLYGQISCCFNGPQSIVFIFGWPSQILYVK